MKSKIYSIINIGGLAVGMAVSLLIGLWIYTEFSYDKFLPAYEQVYNLKINFQLKNGEIKTSDAVPLPLIDAIRKDLPDVKYIVEADRVNEHGLMVGDKKLEIRGLMAGTDFFKIARYPFLKGNPAYALKDMYSIVINESTAKALFENEDPMNKVIRFDNQNNLKVTGVLKDLPKNSSLQFNFVAPFDFFEHNNEWIQQARTQWDQSSFCAYLTLQPQANVPDVNEKIKKIIIAQSGQKITSRFGILLHSAQDWHLYNEFKNGKLGGGYIDYIHMFGLIGALVLLIAAINFMNLSTARSEKRAKEVGIRKAIGSQRKQLILQFLIESVIITFIAFLFSMLLIQFALPPFNRLTGSFVRIPFGNPFFWLAMVGYVLFTGLLAGSRPAFYLSSFNTVKILKGTIQPGRSALLSRKLLVLLQFSCSIALVISTLIIYQQIMYVKNRPTGYDSKQLLMTKMSDDMNSNFSSLRNDLIQSGLVEDVAKASSSITAIGYHTQIDNWPGRKNETHERVAGIAVSAHYFKTLGMELIAGRDFSSDRYKDTASVILNESAMRLIGLKEPLNQVISWNSTNSTIIGVVKDAIMDSPYKPADPTVFAFGDNNNDAQFILYRLSAHVKMQDAYPSIAKIFGTYNPAFPYSYHFVDDGYKRKFKLESLIGTLAAIFAGLAIFISCLGLYALAAFAAEQRSKEIGIRKVLGSSTFQLWMLLCKDFFVLVVISCIIASPVAFYFLNNWLANYDYRITIGPAVFLIAALVALLITLTTISFQSIKAAVANPVKSLKIE